MNKLFFKITAVVLIITLCSSLSACRERVTQFYADRAIVDGEIKASPTEAHFEKDGTFKVTVGVANGFKFAKEIDELIVKLKDKDKNLIVEGTLAIDEGFIVKPKTVSEIICTFRKDEVKINAPDLEVLDSDIQVTYSGAMKDAAPTSTLKGGTYANIVDAYFTKEGALKGTIKINNSAPNAAQLTDMIYNIKDSTGKKLTKATVTIHLNAKLAAVTSLTKNFVIPASNLAVTTKSFDSLQLEYTIK